MDFSNVTSWMIPEGDVLKVVDSQNRIIWQKYTYTNLSYLTVPYGAGMMIPIYIPLDATYEIGMTYKFDSGSVSTSYAVWPMGGIGNNDPGCKLSFNVHNYNRTYRVNYGASGSSSELYIPSSNSSTSWWKPTTTNMYKKQTTVLSNNSAIVKVYSSESQTTPSNTYTNADYNSNYAWNVGSEIDGYWSFGGRLGYSTNTNEYYINSGGNGMQGRIYNAWITIGNVTRNFIPRTQNETGLSGLYDTTEDLFYPLVTTNIPVTNVTISPTSCNLNVGSSKTFNYTITPDNATFKTLTWEVKSQDLDCDTPYKGRVTLTKNADQTCTVTGECASGISYVEIRARAHNGTYSNTASITVKDSTVPVTSVSLNKASDTLGVGGTTQLVATVNPSNASYNSIVWTTTNSSVATVDSSGYVTAVSAGTATIKATVSGKSASCVITVTNNTVSVTGVSVNPSTATIGSNGGEITLTATISPSNATNKNVTWSSSNTSVATVNANGVVTGVNPGSATITCTTSDGGYTGTCAVTVQPIAVTGITLDKHTVSNVGTGDNISFTATVSPANASNTNINITPTGGTCTNLAQNGNVWTFNFKVTQSSGTANVSVKTIDGNYTDSCSISIVNVIPVTGISLNKSDLSLSNGSTYQLQATVSPSNATNKTVNWSSDNPSVATVNSSGLITAVGNGSAKITATTSSGGYTASCDVSVITPVTGITLSTTSTTIKYSSVSNITKTITATVSPSNASNKRVTWSSSNTDIVSVTQGGVIHGEALGTATITCTSVSNPSVSATCTVTVLPTIIIAPASTTLNAGQTTQLSCTTMPSGISIQWVSSNTNVATVNQQGLVTAQSAGTANISAGSNTYGWSNNCTVTVSQSGDPGKSLTIANNTGFEIKYGKANNESTMSTLGSSNSVNVTLASGESLYILRSYSGTTINLSCLSEYSIASGSYRIIYANAIDGETIHAVVSG